MQNVDINAAVIFGAAVLQGVLSTLYFLFNKKGSRIANIFMLTMMVSITLILFQNFMIFNGSYTSFPGIILLFYPLNGLIGPLFFMYVVFLVNPNRGFKMYDILHISLFFVMLYGHWGFLELSGEIKINTVNYLYYEKNHFSPSIIHELILYRLVVLGYGLCCLYIIQSKIKELKQWTSDTSIQYLNRFKLIIYLFILYAMFSLSGYLFSLIFSVSTGRYELYNHILNSIIVVSLSFVTLLQPERLFFTLFKSTPKNKEQNVANTLLLQDLKKVMDTEKPFLDPDLKLHDLAKLMRTTPSILSSHINQTMDVNFYELVNRYRVDEFKRRVQSPVYKKYTLLAIALDAGFNSKASFNRIFKQQTHITPSQFKNKKRSQ